MLKKPLSYPVNNCTFTFLFIISTAKIPILYHITIYSQIKYK